MRSARTEERTMFNMIKADVYRMNRSKGMIIFWLAIIGTYIIPILSRMPGGVSLGMPVTFADDAKLDVRMMGMNFTWFFLLIIPVFVIITSDFSEKTVKNTISSAISRKKYFFVKIATAGLFCIGTFLLGNYLFFFINKLVNGEKYSSEIVTFTKVLVKQLPVVIAIVSLFILVAFFVKRTAAYNAITIVTPIVYSLIAVTFYEIKATKDFAEKTLLRYEVGYMFNRLADKCSYTYRNQCIIASLLISIAALFLAYTLFTKKEID